MASKFVFVPATAIKVWSRILIADANASVSGSLALAEFSRLLGRVSYS